MPLPTASRTCWLSAALALSSAAHAAEPAFDLAAVVVTATRQTTRANEIIADVTVIDREAIEQAGPTTLPALLARQPGLHMVENGGMGKNASIFLRGTGTGHTLLLVDGVPLGSVTSGNPSLHNLPLSQIERIEILRGPASSLYGSDAIGGVIQIFTRRGEGEGRLNAYAGIGSHATVTVQGGISGGSNGPWSYSLAAKRLTSDGFNVAADPVRYRIANGAVPNADADGYRNSAVSAASPTPSPPATSSRLRCSKPAAAMPSIAAASPSTPTTATRPVSRSCNCATASARNLDLDPAPGASAKTTAAASPRHAASSPPADPMDLAERPAPSAGCIDAGAGEHRPGVTSTTNYADKEPQCALRWCSATRATRRPQPGRPRLRYDRQLAVRRPPHRLARLRLPFRRRVAGPDVAEGTAFKAPSFNQLYFPGFGSAGLRNPNQRATAKPP
jgi:hypothetical protein